MKKIRCRISMLLATVLLVSTPMEMLAASKNVSAASLESVVSEIKETHNGAEVVVEDGTINVFISEDEQNTLGTSSKGAARAASASSIYSPYGGMWYNFKQPWYTYVNPDAYTMPYKVVFLPRGKAEDLFRVMNTPGLLDFIIANPISQASVETIIAKIVARFGITFSTSSIIFLYSATAFEFYDMINNKLFSQALGDDKSTNGVRIDYATQSGWPVNYYYKWTGSYVTNSPWQDWSPVFKKGVYSVKEL